MPQPHGSVVIAVPFPVGISDSEPIMRVSFDDPRGNGRRTYKVAHLDGSKCSPPLCTLSKPVPLHHVRRQKKESVWTCRVVPTTLPKQCASSFWICRVVPNGTSKAMCTFQIIVFIVSRAAERTVYCEDNNSNNRIRVLLVS